MLGTSEEMTKYCLIDPDRNVGQTLINNRTSACADGLVSPSIATLYYLRCDSRAAHLPARPCTAILWQGQGVKYSTLRQYNELRHRASKKSSHLQPRYKEITREGIDTMNIKKSILALLLIRNENNLNICWWYEI